jgi:hypothetical protein
MKLTGKSTSLLSIAMLMAGISLTWSADKGTVESLPTMPAVSFASVTSFQITVGNSPRTTISRTGDDSWELTEPINGAADAQVVRSLLRHVNRGVEFDVKVDNENYDEYGLDNGERVLFEIFSSSEVPTHSMSIGSDTFGGASFVKLPNSETVYRGNVGSRMNYARTPADWRDKMVTHIGDSSISSMRIERANDTLSFENTDGPSPQHGADEGWRDSFRRLQRRMGKPICNCILGAKHWGDNRASLWRSSTRWCRFRKAGRDSI